MSPLFAAFIKPSDDIIQPIKVKRKAKYHKKKLPITKWQKKYGYLLRLLHANYLHESQFTLNEYNKGHIMNFEQFSKSFYRAKLSSSVDMKSGTNNKYIPKYEIPIIKVNE